MQHKHKERIKVSFSQGMNLLLPYIRKKVMEQTRSMAVIAIYLLLFQILILRVAIANASVITLGLLLVIMGLSFFMEGLFIGIMPLGEVIGIKLPQKSNLLVIMIFSFILGFGATLAEPAIGVLRAAGTSVKAWDAPLLYLLLNRYPGYLVGAVGIGVGLAVMAGMLRFLYSWSLKPFAIVLVLLLLSVSVWAVFEPNMRSLTGVAWDCGGITTGPVTVPLVLALGIGICRVVGSAGSGTAGFGVVTLASLFPILTVMMLGIPFLHSVPKPMAEAEFMAARERAEIVRMFETPEQMTGYVLQNASPSSQLIYFGGDTAKMISCLQSLVCDDIKCARVMGADPGMLRKWALEKGTSIQQAAVFGSVSLVPDTDIKKAELDPRTFGKTVISNTKAACQAIIPLCLFLIFMLIFVLRERLNRYDEVLTGIVFALIGLGLFNIGIEFGLANLGKQVGGLLPSTFKAIPVQDEAKRIQGFDTALVQTAIKPDGERERFFYTKEHGVYIPLLFDNDKYDPDKHQYLYVPQRGPIAGREGGPAGIVILLLFALIMGYGATLAEPALNALGLTVEELSVGTFKKRLLMQSVAIGVGIGIAFGLVKIVYDVPIIYLLIPPYIAALVLTIFSTEEFVNIGWDSAGVTTGPVTVPLVLALGLGVGIQMNVVEGFGILAMASVWPILSVLLVGIVIRWRRRMMVKRIIGKQKEEAAV